MIRANYGPSSAPTTGFDDVWQWISETQYFGLGPYYQIPHTAQFYNVNRYAFCQPTATIEYLIGTGTRPMVFYYDSNSPTKFPPVASQPFGTNPAYGVRCLHLDGKTYAALGFVFPAPYQVNLYLFDSINGNVFFSTPSQILNVTGDTTAIKEFSVGNSTYLITAENSRFAPTANTRIWQWNSMTSSFNTNPVQTISTSGALDVDIFTIDTTTYMVLAVGPVGTPTPNYIYKWNVNLQLFDPISIINDNGGGVFSIQAGDVVNTKYLFAGFNTGFNSGSYIYKFI